MIFALTLGIFIILVSMGITIIVNEHGEKKRHKKHPHHIDLVISGIVFENFKILNSIIMAVDLIVGQSVTATLGLQDRVTNLPVEGTFANTTMVSDNEAVLTVDPSTLKETAVAEGAANVTFESDCTYVNSKGQTVTEHKSVVAVATVSLAANGVDLVVTFTTPA